MPDASFLSNKLLAALPAAEFNRLTSQLELIHFSVGQILYEPNQTIDYAYFPLSAVVSLLNLMESGDRVETATVGNEGMIGVPLVLGTNQIAMRSSVQIAGDALRMPAEQLQLALSENRELSALLLRYIQTLMSQISQNLSCLRLHSVQERCCYLLLLLRDRVGVNELLLTHEALAQTVGVRRDRIGEIINTLERAGLVQHQRGRILILDRFGLESATCECYRIIRSTFERSQAES